MEPLDDAAARQEAGAYYRAMTQDSPSLRPENLSLVSPSWKLKLLFILVCIPIPLFSLMGQEMLAKTYLFFLPTGDWGLFGFQNYLSQLIQATLLYVSRFCTVTTKNRNNFWYPFTIILWYFQVPQVGTVVLITSTQSLIIFPGCLTSHHKEIWSVGQLFIGNFYHVCASKALMRQIKK